jgi:branched-chain amino acid transport system ATP-binding protein
MLLEIKGLTKQFGGLTAVNNFDMTVSKGEIVGLIGPNGAGKSTLFNLITGIYPSTRGQVIFDGKDITRTRPDQAAALGIGRTFQLNPLFADFTVIQNVSASFHLHPHSSLLAIYFNTAAYRKNEAFIKEQALKILQLVGLEKVKDELARNLPHGYQKMLGVARALATSPRLLLLDEPLGGMNPSEIEFSLNAIRKMRDQGITVVVVEHNMQILTLCDRVVVISFGQKICEGLPAEVRENKDVIAAYFGGEHVARY